MRIPLLLRERVGKAHVNDLTPHLQKLSVCYWKPKFSLPLSLPPSRYALRRDPYQDLAEAQGA